MKKIMAFLGIMLLFATANEAFAQKKIKKNKMYTTESGLQYKVTEVGKGKKANTGDKVVVHYTGKLENDTVFDSSYKRGQPFSFVLGQGQVIPGWDEGISLLREGDKATFIIPSNLGYGDANIGSIPPNSTLIFDVELIQVIDQPKPYDVTGKDTITTASGLKYIKILESDGIQAKAGMKVTVHYTGYFEDGKIFDSSVQRGEPISFSLGIGQVIKGWEEGISLLKVGEKARLIIPYNLAYGEEGRGPIPPKATLIFDVELVNAEEVIKPVPFDVSGKDTVTTKSGLKYIIVKENVGQQVMKGDKVVVHYTGYLLDGRIFDSSVQRGEPISFQLGQGQVIKGWDEGVGLLKTGEKARLIIPAELGYGNQEIGNIPSNSTLIFDVELVGIE